MLLSLVPANKRDPVGCFIAGRECMPHVHEHCHCVSGEHWDGRWFVVGGNLLMLTNLDIERGEKTASGQRTAP